MIRKIITICILLFIALFSYSYIASAQRGIDPSLKPEYAPDVPATGAASKDECENPKKIGDYQPPKGVWDKNSQMCSTEVEAPINAFFQVIGGALLMLSGGIAVIVITIGGILYITSRGNQQQLEKAKSTLLYGVMGMLIIIFSYFIVRFVLTVVTGNA